MHDWKWSVDCYSKLFSGGFAAWREAAAKKSWASHHKNPAATMMEDAKPCLSQIFSLSLPQQAWCKRRINTLTQHHWYASPHEPHHLLDAQVYWKNSFSNFFFPFELKLFWSHYVRIHIWNNHIKIIQPLETFMASPVILYFGIFLYCYHTAVNSQCD